jgi:DNA primase
LANKAGVVLKKDDSEFAESRSERQRLCEICELAAKFYEKQLEAGRVGAFIKKYFADRGFKNEAISIWRLGYAPDDWYALSEFLKKRGYTDAEIIKSGLVVEKTTTDYRRPTTATGAVARSPSAVSVFYDRFRNRIIFPLCDLNGQVVGFAGRVLPGDNKGQAKYINSPQTPIYDKSRMLYGLDRAKTEIRAKDFCIVVEGYTDVIMSHQAGIKNTVASSGTALTEEQLKIIGRYTENLILAFDMDIAGDTATKRGIDLAIGHGFNVKIIQLAGGGKEKKDPADIIKDNPQVWLKAIEDAQGIIEFYFANAFSQNDCREPAGKKKIAKIILPLLKKIPDPVERSHWIQELAKRLRVQEKLLFEAMQKVKNDELAPDSNRPTQLIKERKKNRRAVLEGDLLGLFCRLLEIPGNLEEALSYFEAEKIEEALTDGQPREIFASLKTYLSSSADKNPDLKKWEASLSPDLSSFLNQILFHLELREVDGGALKGYFDKCLKELRREKVKQELARLQYEIKELDSPEDKKRLNELLGAFNVLAKNLLE